MSTLHVLIEAAMRPVRHGLSNIVQSVIWAVAIALLALLTLGFALGALYIWLADRYSSLDAALILAGVFLVLTIIAVIIRSALAASQRARARREAQRSAEQIRSVLGTVAGVASATRLIGRGARPDGRPATERMAHRIGPWTLIGLALMGGFVGAHIVDRGGRR